MPPSSPAISYLAALFFICGACRPSVQAQAGGGTLVIATTGNYGSLFPPAVSSTTARQITELVYDYLTEVGLSLNTFDDRTFAPRLAQSWDWSSDSLSLAVHLDPKARWHDGQPVRSTDITYSYRIYSDSAYSSLAQELSDIDSVTTADSLTAIFWFKKRYPLQFYDATSQMQILPQHIYSKIPIDSLNEIASQTRPIGTGRYRFVTEKAGESIEVVADTTNYRGAPKIRRILWRVFGSPSEASNALIVGEADVYDNMRLVDVAKAKGNPNLKLLVSPGSDYYFMAFNIARSPFGSRDLRRALTMAVDRTAIVRNVYDSLASAAVGPTVSYFPSTSRDLRQLPDDPSKAASLLDSLGWRRNPTTGIRSRGGRELKFKVIFPSTSSSRTKVATMLQAQLHQVGVELQLDPVDYTTFNSYLVKHDFDVALINWHLGTSPASIRILWATDAPQNFGSYSNRIFDAYVDSAISARNASKNSMFYNRAYQIAIDDAAAIWLQEPRLVIGLSKRINPVPYRPDAWWWSLPEWFIPPVDYIARDMAHH